MQALTAEPVWRSLTKIQSPAHEPGWRLCWAEKKQRWVPSELMIVDQEPNPI